MKLTQNELDDMQKRTRKSVLWDYTEEINEMRRSAISFRIIQEWLKSKHNVKVTIQNISQFHKRHRDKKKTNKKGLSAMSKENNGLNQEDGMFSNLYKGKI